MVDALADTEKLAKLHEQGLGDMDDFMASFEIGQQATDVKCGTTAGSTSRGSAQPYAKSSVSTASFY